MSFSFKSLYISAIAIMVTITACASGPSKKSSAAQGVTTVKLAKGTVQIITFGAVTLHAYQTNDCLGDESYVLESKKNLVAIELPGFHSNLTEFVEYVKGLNKPLTNGMVSYHRTGTDYLKDFPSAKLRATESTRKSLKEGKTTIGGFDFVISGNADAYEIERFFSGEIGCGISG